MVWLSRLLLAITIFIQDDPAKLIEKLRSDSVEEREEAAKRLADIGRAAFPVLEKAVKDPDREVAARAVRIRRVIDLREALSPELRKRYLGIEGRLDADPHAATQVFIDLPILTPDRDEDPNQEHLDPFPVSDLKLLARPAVQGARGEEIEGLAFKLRERKLVEAAPEFIRFLSHPEAELRGLAAEYLGGWGFRPAIPAIFKLLEDPWGNNRESAAEALLSLEAKEVVPGLRDHLKSSDPDVRIRAAHLLGEFGAREAIPDLLTICRASKGTEWGALHGLVRMGVQEAAPFLLIQVREGPEVERGSALSMLVTLRSREAIVFLRPRLENSDPLTCANAIQSLGEIGDPSAIPDVEPFVNHPSPLYSGSAMFALAGMGCRDQLPAILRALKEGDSNRRWFAVRALGALRCPDHVAEMTPLLGDRDADLRWATIEALGRIGAREALPALRKCLQSPLKRDRELAGEAVRAIEERK
jgi:HEAT repeat protein